MLTKDGRLLFTGTGANHGSREVTADHLQDGSGLCPAYEHNGVFFQIGRLQYPFVAKRRDVSSKNPAATVVAKILKTERLDRMTVKMGRKLIRPDLVVFLCNPFGGLQLTPRLRLHPDKQHGDAQGHFSVADMPEPGLAHQGGEFGGRRELGYRGRQILVGKLVF